jgi:hypothetical protein
MRPIGTNKGRILNTNSRSREILEEEKHKLSLLCYNNYMIEKDIKIKLQSLNIPIQNIKKKKLIVNKENISKQRNQITWLIELNINKQLLEEENHKKYLHELYQALEDNSPDFAESNVCSQYVELIIVFQDLGIIL